METIKIALTVAKGWFEANRELVDKYAVFSSGYMGMVDEKGGLQLYDGRIRLTDKNGKTLEEFDPQNYIEVIAEHVEDWSYLKFPYYRKMGYPAGHLPGRTFGPAECG